MDEALRTHRTDCWPNHGPLSLTSDSRDFGRLRWFSGPLRSLILHKLCCMGQAHEPFPCSQPIRLSKVYVCCMTFLVPVVFCRIQPMCQKSNRSPLPFAICSVRSVNRPAPAALLVARSFAEGHEVSSLWVVVDRSLRAK